MKVSKHLLDQPWMRAFAVSLIEGYIRLAFATIRWTMVGEAHIAPYWRNDQPLIAAYWHGRLLMMSKAWHGERPCWVLTSRSRDGGFIGQVVERFGFKIVQGSSERQGEGVSKGGTDALRRYLRILADGGVVVIIPDGPRGPRMQAQPGIAALLKMSKAPLMPIAWSTRWRVVLGSWDRMILPIPFSRGVFIYRQPIRIDPQAQGLDEITRLVEAALTEVAAAADEAMGHPPISAPEIRPAEIRPG